MPIDKSLLQGSSRSSFGLELGVVKIDYMFFFCGGWELGCRGVELEARDIEPHSPLECFGESSLQNLMMNAPLP